MTTRSQLALVLRRMAKFPATQPPRVIAIFFPDFPEDGRIVAMFNSGLPETKCVEWNAGDLAKFEAGPPRGCVRRYFGVDPAWI